ncbi:MAG: 2Fe-2S iron-sulfur cluster-binding protein [Anaerotruncus sp.]|nr:2Fe-2S iron-sulfur cluster-binding protein [Anaerotruncus sp.]
MKTASRCGLGQTVAEPGPDDARRASARSTSASSQADADGLPPSFDLDGGSRRRASPVARRRISEQRGGSHERRSRRFTLDGEEITAEPGQTILEAADAAGIYIPRLCHMQGPRAVRQLPRLHRSRVNGRPSGGLHAAGRRRAWWSRATPRS